MHVFSTTGNAVIAKPAENRHLLATSPEFYDRLKDTYDDRFYRQEVLGEYLSFDGNAVYSSFQHRLTSTREPSCSFIYGPKNGLFWAAIQLQVTTYLIHENGYSHVRTKI